MRLSAKLGLLLMVPAMVLGQSTSSSSGSQSGTVADELKALREAIAQQQQQLAQQQKQIQTLQQALEEKTAGTPHVANASLRVPASPPAVVPAAAAQEGKTEAKTSPLSFRIGGTEFTPGGFVDFENVFRTKNTASNIATSFGTIPYSNTTQGNLTEFRMTGQYSRYSLKVTGKYGANDVVGYLEGDFNGNDATNVFVSSNSHTNRLRLYWLDLKRGKWEFLGGQTWGLQTPNRFGLSPNPSDVFVPIGEDAQTHVGLPYTRAAEFRAVYHFTDQFQWGVALQNPDQFVGAGEIIFPFAFNAALGPQFDSANQTGVPNAFPDIHTKFAWDGNVSGKRMHFEAGGFLTSAKITNLPTGTTTFDHHMKVGGTFHGAFNFELAKGFRVMANGLWGAGNGRYLIGLGPQAVVFPVQTSPTTFNVDVSMVHAGATIVGSELQVKNSLFGFYYGGFYFQRNSFLDVTSPLPVKPTIGFGGINSPNTANRAIQEGTISWTQTFWKNPQYGAVLLVTQASYVTRAPWFVATGAPKNAHLMMGYASLKYVLP